MAACVVIRVNASERSFVVNSRLATNVFEERFESFPLLLMSPRQTKFLLFLISLVVQIFALSRARR